MHDSNLAKIKHYLKYENKSPPLKKQEKTKQNKKNKA